MCVSYPTRSSFREKKISEKHTSTLCTKYLKEGPNLQVRSLFERVLCWELIGSRVTTHLDTIVDRVTLEDREVWRWLLNITNLVPSLEALQSWRPYTYLDWQGGTLLWESEPCAFIACMASSLSGCNQAYPTFFHSNLRGSLSDDCCGMPFAFLDFELITNMCTLIHLIRSRFIHNLPSLHLQNYSTILEVFIHE